MANWSVHAPLSVKAPTKDVALKNARGLVTVSKIVAPQPPTQPTFLKDTIRQWSDDCSSGTPVEDGRWSLYPMGRKDGVQASSTKISDVKPGRFAQIQSGGRNAYRFTTARGDNIWTPGNAGRSELSYPVGDPGNAPAHVGPPGAFFFFEGRRHVLMFTVELGADWNVDATSWRVLNQWKQNEWADSSGTTPQLSFQQRAGEWIITSRSRGGSDDIIWRMDAEAPCKISFAVDVTFSSDPSKGKLRVYADTNQDGTYEYSSAPWQGQTLLARPGGGSFESTWHTGCYEGNAPDSVIQLAYSING